ncbi:3-keto-5-aminohexanoate cleavage protein [Aestuariirhabdus sp. Z084]|uniref:3-keto-5-aminohexanoate cleavage protein n=1 Tax=Aestuariirhabdus haliotis TaxID=2918751 RepID=UPI00201B4372|nr:3-keto-5-aminohexanoate cleavage protein [Aestuariirhabdus haliotis]MCL6417015.1 3-keto-5-aminohexanoate cleavage protein [Aestuariirhabdus haliotis]MCL6421048.1 3-keto-5-aminohexanoate cleavage protein [Aestuariirhabdus haliotis]
MDKVIVNAALTGMVPTRDDNPYIPLSCEEIVADAVRVVGAGASVLHLHIRYENGEPAYEGERFGQLFDAVRKACPGVIISGSTSGRTVTELEKRAEVLDASPDLGSLTMGSLNFPRQASINAPQTIVGLARKMRERGIVPEIELFDLGMVDYTRTLIERGELKGPFYANILLGSLGTLSSGGFNLAMMVNALPSGMIWSGAGIGRYQFEMNCLALAMGGHVRVGLEDNIWMDPLTKQDPASNVRLVERVVGVARSMGREPASCGEVRQLLQLPLVRAA